MYLELYNVLGQRLDIIIDSVFDIGKSSFVYNTADTASGVYFLRLNLANRLLIRRFVITR